MTRVRSPSILPNATPQEKRERLTISRILSFLGWSHAAMLIMPGVQYSSLLAVLNRPHKTVQDQRARTAQDTESQTYQYGSALPFASYGSSVEEGPPLMKETGLTVLERGRRKLPALIGGKKRRSKGEKTSLS